MARRSADWHSLRLCDDCAIRSQLAAVLGAVNAAFARVRLSAEECVKTWLINTSSRHFTCILIALICQAQLIFRLITLPRL